MRIFIKKLYDQEGKEIGATLYVVLGDSTNIKEKYIIESILIQYAFDKLYPNEGLKIYQDTYIDTPSITVLRNINKLPEQEITI